MKDTAQIVMVDLMKDIDIIDFMPAKIVGGNKTIYHLSITCVQDKPRVINAIYTNISTETLEEMAEKIQSLIDTGMFDGNNIVSKTTMDVFEYTESNTDNHTTEEIDWLSHGVKINDK
jgi:hypothetical protein